MVNEIGLLAQRWSDDQRKMRELELQTLQYQINPHFLFNTLNTLKWIATLNHVTPVSHGIDALSSLLQSTLIKKDELIPFDDELRNLKTTATFSSCATQGALRWNTKLKMLPDTGQYHALFCSRL